MGIILAALMLFVAVGCAPAPPPPQPKQAAADATSAGQSADAKGGKAASQRAADMPADDILRRMLANYRGAATYQDEGVVRLAWRERGTPRSLEWPASVAFERPNKLSLAAYQATVKCDGRLLRARIEDEESNHIDGQIVELPAPRVLKPGDLARDELLDRIVAGQLRRQPIQLELLIESPGLVSAFGGDLASRRLDDATHDGRPCFRVEVPTPGGALVFWIDHAEFLLRRLDYPATELMPQLAADPSASDVQLLADLRGAKLGQPIAAGTFAMETPPTAKRMRSFVVPPQPLPTELFGRRPGAFHFTGLNGERVSDRDLEGKIAVLAWYHDNPACEATMQQVSLARQRLEGDPDVAVLAIATDPTTTTNDQVARRLAAWQVDLPVVRDLEAFGDKAFAIQHHPTIVVLDREGRVQIFQAGGNPALAEQLVAIVERLKSGDDLAADIASRHERERQEYERLVASGGPPPGEVIEVQEAVIRRRSQPQRLKLAPLWSCQELKSPGNIVVAQQPEGPARVYVFDGWRTVVEIDAEGQIAARHALQLPDEAGVTYARAARDQRGTWFVASAPLAPQLFVFDDSWRLVRTFPPEGEPPLAVLDLALADLGDEDGTLDILAGCGAEIGLVAVSRDGQTLWRNRTFPNVASIAVTPPDDVGLWDIFASGDSGEVLRITRYGLPEKPAAIANWPVLRLLAGRFQEPTQAALLAVAVSPQRETFAVGLTRQLQETWNYPLPAGAHYQPIEPVASSELLPGRRGEWWLAGPDGSIHVISEDGEWFDSFHYGAVLTGLATTRMNGQPVLLIATDAGLDAWVIESAE